MYLKNKGGILECGLCPHLCAISPGKSGICGIRFNNNGREELPFYGKITGLALDPIEKKPFLHFHPGSRILSVGFAGCNLRCPFCQNWRISQNVNAPGRFMEPPALVALASEHQQIAYTYSEPLVHIEFLLDCMREARKANIANVLVTNGSINADAAGEVLALTDTANIDLKCFSRETYAKVLAGDLDTVLNFIRTAYEKRIHVEITTLVVPGMNDRESELNDCVNFLSDLGRKNRAGKSTIPWHLSAYHPDWKWKAPPTSPEFLIAAAERARQRLAHVYTGNLPGKSTYPGASGEPPVRYL